MKLKYMKSRIFHFTKGALKPIRWGRIFVSKNLLLIEPLEV